VAPVAEPGSTDGDALAAWLEGLGLAVHLGSAGLPTFTRDDVGHAHWADPNTGDPLTPDQLAALDRLLHSDGDEPAHAVPLSLVQLRRRAQVHAALLDSPTYDYAALAALRGISENAARFAVHKGAERHTMLVVPYSDGVLVPAFQFDADGEQRGDLLAVLEPLLSSGMDPWQVWAWLTQPAALLSGAVPHEAARDPEEEPIVVHAAIRLAERARA